MVGQGRFGQKGIDKIYEKPRPDVEVQIQKTMQMKDDENEKPAASETL
jgi:hypothetical protein